MNKPGNKPSDKTTIPLVLLSSHLMGAAIALLCFAGFDSCWKTFMLLAVVTIQLAALSQRLYLSRVRRYLSTVCTLFVLCLFAGCEAKFAPPEQSSAYVDRLKAIEAKLDACQPHEPTQVLFEQDHCDPTPE